jgi:hypothetical protein
LVLSISDGNKWARYEINQLYGLTEEEIKIVYGNLVDSRDQGKTPAIGIPLLDLETDEEAATDAQPGDYFLYKCGDWGKVITGFMKDGHVRDVHRGRNVEWKKLGG